MNGKDLFRALSQVNDELIEETDNDSASESTTKNKSHKAILKRVVPAAACFAVVVLAIAIWLVGQNRLPVSAYTDPDTNKKYSLTFNNAGSASAADIMIEGHFWNDLTSEQTAKLMPSFAGKYKGEGIVHYSKSEKTGAVSIFSVNMKFKVDGKDVDVAMAPKEIPNCYYVPEPKYSEIEGVKVDAGSYSFDREGNGITDYVYYADFKIDDVAYSVELTGSEDDADWFTGLIVDIILGKKADLSCLNNPEVPSLLRDVLSQEQAYGDPDFGSYLPGVPGNFKFEKGMRFINQNSDFLSVLWCSGLKDVSYKASNLDDEEKGRIVNPENKTLYDLSLYPIPWADSMPEDKREIIENPVFKAEELTLDMVKMRAYYIDEYGDEEIGNVRMRFSVLYGDVVLEISTEGVSPEYLYNELMKIQNP